MLEQAVVNQSLVVDGMDESCAMLRAGAAELALYSRRSPAKESANEDALLAMPLEGEALLLAVADGCGGMPAGATAAERALTALGAAFEGAEATMENLTSVGLAAFDLANQAVLDMKIGAGTTLIVALICDGCVRLLHAGDSPGLIVGQRGRIRHMAVAHSPTGYAVEAGLLSEREAMAHDDRSVILNLVGSEEMHVGIGPIVTLKPRDSVLIASDGLTDNLLPKEIVDFVRTGPLEESVNQLAEAAQARMASESADRPGHPDDLTILAYRPTAHASS